MSPAAGFGFCEPKRLLCYRGIRLRLPASSLHALPIAQFAMRRRSLVLQDTELGAGKIIFLGEAIRRAMTRRRPIFMRETRITRHILSCGRPQHIGSAFRREYWGLCATRAIGPQSRCACWYARHTLSSYQRPCHIAKALAPAAACPDIIIGISATLSPQLHSASRVAKGNILRSVYL